MLGIRDWHVASSGLQAERVHASEKGMGGMVDGRDDGGLESFEAEVRRLVRGFGRPRWVEVVVR